jgi:AcrR family transcriptional regulator
VTGKRAPATRRTVASRAAQRRRGAADVDTRERLVAAATRLFAEHGFHKVSVRDICAEAGANVAAVNYHFAGKLGLYREVVSRAVDTIRAGSAGLVFAPDDAPADERIRHYVRAYVPLVAGRNPRVEVNKFSWIHKLLRHETSEPTPLAPWIAEQAIVPRMQYLSRAVAELLGCEPGDPRAIRCVISIQSQCQFYAPDKFRDAAFPGWPPDAAELAAAADHIAEFSLAGIRRITALG